MMTIRQALNDKTKHVGYMYYVKETDEYLTKEEVEKFLQDYLDEEYDVNEENVDYGDEDYANLYHEYELCICELKPETIKALKINKLEKAVIDYTNKVSDYKKYVEKLNKTLEELNDLRATKKL